MRVDYAFLDDEYWKKFNRVFDHFHLGVAFRERGRLSGFGNWSKMSGFYSRKPFKAWMVSHGVSLRGFWQPGRLSGE